MIQVTINYQNILINLKSSANNYFNNGTVRIRCKSIANSSVKLPFRVYVEVSGDKQLVVLLFNWVVVKKWPGTTIILEAKGNHFCYIVTPFNIW